MTKINDQLRWGRFSWEGFRDFLILVIGVAMVIGLLTIKAQMSNADVERERIRTIICQQEAVRECKDTP